MKNIYLLSIITILSLLSCNIDRDPKLSITDDVYWRNADDLKAAANYFYTFLPGFTTDENWSDNSFGRSSDPISDGSLLTPNSSSDYTNPYKLIRASNKLIEKGVAIDDGSDPEIKRYIAEARFFRAFAYFNLVRIYGDVPLITTVLSDDSEQLYGPRNPREEVVKQIYDDLQFAMDNLPNASNISASDYGRISKTAAMAYRAKVGLFEGTRAKYHGYGNPQEHLNMALKDSKNVIMSGEHELFPDYFLNFQYDGEGPSNKENILVREYGVSRSDIVVYNNYFRSTIEQGNINPTRSLVESYLMVDGLPWDKSPLFEKPVKSEDWFPNRDARLSATVFKTGDSYIASRPVFTIANPNFNTTGWAFRKYTNIDDWETQRGLMDYNVLRYGEVLLTFAEAYFELNESITDDILNFTINPLRDRGGVAHLTNAFVAANNLNMRDEIRRERRVELAQEDQRYWDLLRWKTAEVELPKTVYGNDYFPDELGEVNITVTDDNVIIVNEAKFRTFDPAKNYLWPLPTDEIALNNNLVQNPGW